MASSSLTSGNESVRETDPARDVDAPDPERHESDLERLDRNTGELLQELRVAVTGVQVMLAFLLVVPFNTRFTKLTSFERDVYFATLLCVTLAAVLLMSPSIHHRVLFRLRQKRYLVAVGNQAAIVGMAFLTLGFTGILVLISDFMWGAVTAGIVGGVGLVLIATVWFGMPFARRRKLARRGSADLHPFG